MSASGRRVALVFGGRSVEHEVSVSSARTVSAALAEAGLEVVPVGIAPDGPWLGTELSRAALEGDLDAFAVHGGEVGASLGHLLDAGADVVFPLVHGTWGEDGTLQGLCEMLDLPYVGADVEASAVAMDKLRCKRLLAAVGLPVLAFEGISRSRFEPEGADFRTRCERLALPLFVKPSAGGSSVGISKVTGYARLEEAIRHAFEFDDQVLVEQGASGRELECAVLGYPTLEASRIGEIVPGREFYDYADKYLEEGAGLIAPAEIPEGLERRLQSLAVAAFEAVGGTGMARVDFLLDGDDPYVNELNTVPGFTAISMYPRLWSVSGVPLPVLVSRLVTDAVARHGDRHRLDRGIKAWLGELRSKG